MYKALRKSKDSKGFTLIELLITIVIIGVLAAVVVLAIGGLTGAGANSACKATKDAAETAAVAYYANEAPVGGALQWPDDYNDLIPKYMQARAGVAVAAGTLTGSNWVLTIGAGGGAQTTFTGPAGC